MTTTIQLSDKRADAILLVKVEVDSGAPLEAAEEEFAAAAGLVGLGQAYESFGAAPPATVPGITQLTRPSAHATGVQDPWGQPPVQPYQAPAPQYQQQAPAPALPSAAAPQCQHGTKEYISGTSQKTGKPWKAWACPARRDDPTKCEKEWIR